MRARTAALSGANVAFAGIGVLNGDTAENGTKHAGCDADVISLSGHDVAAAAAPGAPSATATAAAAPQAKAATPRSSRRRASSSVFLSFGAVLSIGAVSTNGGPTRPRRRRIVRTSSLCPWLISIQLDSVGETGLH